MLERGSCEWESVAASSRVSGEGRTSDWATQVGCGLGLRSQWALGYGRSRAGAESSSSLVAAGKLSLLEGGDDSLSLALAVAAGWQRSAGEGTRFDNASANLAASLPLGHGWLAHANLGALHLARPRKRQTTWALALEKTLVEGWDLGAETYGEGQGKPWFGVGLRWQASTALSLNASWARQRDTPGVRLLTAGAKLEF